MTAPQPYTEPIIEINLSHAEHDALWSHFFVGDGILRGPNYPGWVDEVGQPMLSRREWGMDEQYLAHHARVGQALTSLSQRNSSDECLLKGTRDALSYIGTCIFLSLLSEGLIRAEIDNGDPGQNPAIGVYSRLIKASIRPPTRTPEQSMPPQESL